jgi:predicted  nucleic acid-binding Zn-ribbon protein
VEQLKSLADMLDLQEIDLQIDRLLDGRSSVPELDVYRKIHTEVEALTAELDAAEATLKTAEQGLHKTNGELEIAAEKAANEQNRLYAGGLSARDADFLRREVELLYVRVSKMEDEVLVFMEQKEEGEALVARLNETLDATTAEKERLTGLIQDQWRVIDKELAMKEERKALAISLVDEYLLEIYDGMRNASGGRVVGRLSDGVCGACHLRLSAAEVARIGREDPPRCIHCRAILVL